MTGTDQQLLWSSTGGAATVEYVIVLVLVAMVLSVAIYLAGVPLVRAFEFARLLIASPIP